MKINNHWKRKKICIWLIIFSTVIFITPVSSSPNFAASFGGDNNQQQAPNNTAAASASSYPYTSPYGGKYKHSPKTTGLSEKCMRDTKSRSIFSSRLESLTQPLNNQNILNIFLKKIWNWRFQNSEKVADLSELAVSKSFKNAWVENSLNFKLKYSYSTTFAN